MTVEIAAHRPRASPRCPACSEPSRSPHGGYSRRPADLPSVGREVRLVLWVRRFLCRNAGCGRRTFAEPLPGLIAPYARRTRRLAAAQSRLAVATGGEAGARLLGQLGMPTSPDTLLRLVRRLPVAGTGKPTGARRRRLGNPQGTDLRQHSGRSRAALRRGSAAGSQRGTTCGLATAAPWHPHTDPRPVDRVRLRHDRRCAPGTAGGRPLAPAAERPADGRALARNRPWQAPTAASRGCVDDNASTARWCLSAEPDRDRRRC